MLMNEIIHADCMDIMTDIPDKFFELAVVDPPYGINICTEIDRSGFKENTSRNSMTKFEQNMKNKQWDNITPDKKYFDELKRISVNQIIWGGNYFIEHLNNTRCLIAWDKMTYVPTMSQIEIAWTSFKTHSKLIKINSNQSDRIHSCQKPIALYRWLLQNYEKPGDKIIDTHSGSGSLACACHLEGFDFLAIEKDEDYYKSSCERLETLRSQGRLFI